MASDFLFLRNGAIPLQMEVFVHLHTEHPHPGKAGTSDIAKQASYLAPRGEAKLRRDKVSSQCLASPVPIIQGWTGT